MQQAAQVAQGSQGIVLHHPLLELFSFHCLSLRLEQLCQPVDVMQRLSLSQLHLAAGKSSPAQVFRLVDLSSELQNVSQPTVAEQGPWMGAAQLFLAFLKRLTMRGFSFFHLFLLLQNRGQKTEICSLSSKIATELLCLS